MFDLINKLDNRMNPIVVKELRQGMQSRFIIIIVNVLLIALSAAYLLTVMLNPDVLDEATGGQMLFSIFLGILLAATSIGVPIYMIARLCSERNDTNVDLFFTTSLSSLKIIRGKFIAGMTLVTLLYSICLPFMFCTSLLRGFDIPVMLFSLSISYTTTMFTVMLAIVIGSFSLPRVLTPFIIFVSLLFFSWITISFVYMSIGLLFFGVQSFLFRESLAITIGGFLVYCVFFFLGLKLLGSLAVGLLSSPSSNRTGRLRAWGTISIVVSFFVVLLYAGVIGLANGTSLDDFMEKITASTVVWLFLCNQFLCGMLFIAMCEPDGFSRRIIKDRLDGHRKRLFGFLYTHGASSGFTWVILHAIGIWAVFIFFLIAYAVTSPSAYAGVHFDDILCWNIMIFCSMVCYVFLTKGLMRTVFKKIPTKYAWGLFLVLTATLPIAAMIFCFAINPTGWFDNLFWKLFIPAPDFLSDDLSVRVGLTAIGAIVMIGTSIPVGLCDLETYTADRVEPRVVNELLCTSPFARVPHEEIFVAEVVTNVPPNEDKEKT